MSCRAIEFAPLAATGPERPLRTEHCGCAICGADDATPVACVPDFEYGTCSEALPYVRCARCSHLYLQRRPVASELSRIYPPRYGNHDPKRTQALTFRIKSWLDARTIRRLVSGLPPNVRVLDVGCADGRLLDVCRHALPHAQALRGIEVSSAAARGALQKGYPVVVGSVDELELGEASADLVFMQQVIEHVYHPARVLPAIARCLSPGGLLMIETPCAESLDARLFRRRYWGGYHSPRHFNLFTARSMTRLAEKAGLEVVRVEYTPQPIHWAWSVRHALADRGVPDWLLAPLQLDDAGAMGIATLLELAAFAMTGRMSNMRVVLRRAGSEV